MPDTAATSNSTTLLLFPVCWIQTVHTHRAFTLRTEAEASKRTGGRFTVPGLGNILELPFELNFVRGPANWNVPAQPTDARGFLTCYENRTDEFGMQRALISGAISLPEAVFDDIWERARLSPDFHSMILITVRPVCAHGADDTIWDRAKDKFLSVLEPEFTFKRDQKGSPDRR